MSLVEYSSGSVLDIVSLLCISSSDEKKRLEKTLAQNQSLNRKCDIELWNCGRCREEEITDIEALE